MILPNVLNRPASALPGLMFLDGNPQRLSTMDYFRSWEPLPESGALAFPRLLDIRGSEFRQDRIDPERPVDNVSCLLRSSWSLMASAARRWGELSDAYRVPGAPQVVLREFKPADVEFPEAGRFDDGLVASRRLGSVVMDDSEGRILEVTQKSPDADLVVTVGWQVDSYSAIVRQETRIAKNGAMTVGYDFEFDWSFFEGLKKAAGLSRDNDAERLMMRLAALIQNSGQYATGSAGSFVFERSERVTQYRSTEETFRIGLPHQPGASVVYRRSSHSQKLTIQLMPTRGSHKPFPLKPPLLEQLWNPVYARALTRIFGNPPSA